MGLDPDLLADAYSTLKAGSEIGSEQKELSQTRSGQGGRHSKKNYLNKELIYEDEQAFIYQRGDTVKKTYYLRIFDQQSKKPYVKSLRQLIAQGQLLKQEPSTKRSKERLIVVSD